MDIQLELPRDLVWLNRINPNNQHCEYLQCDDYPFYFLDNIVLENVEMNFSEQTWDIQNGYFTKHTAFFQCNKDFLTIVGYDT